jgi:tRNA-dihydrouridine synthase
MHIFASLLHEKRPLFLLAPLAALGHRGLRELIHAYGGCDLYFSEMISADALMSGSQYASFYLDPGPEPGRLVYQLVGAEQAGIVAAAGRLLETAARREAESGHSGWAGLDVNMGCSAPEMVRQGAGVNWMTRPDEARRLLAALRPLVPADQSLSVKIRIGETEDFDHLEKFCRGLQAEGIDFLTFHPRLRKDPWSRPARWGWFRRLADSLELPLVANGDIRDGGSLGALKEAWGEGWPAGVMVGRAAVRQPWIFRHLAELAAPGRLAAAPLPERIDLLEVARRFHASLEAWQPRDFWLTRAKRFHAFFGQNLAYGHRVAAQIQSINDYGAILPFLQAYLEEHPEERFVQAR